MSLTSSKGALVILIQLSLLFACQLFETHVPEPIVPSPMAVSPSLQPISPTHRLTSSAPITPTTTLIASATPMATPETPYPEEWLAFVDQQPARSHPSTNTMISFIRQDGSGLLQPKMFEQFYSMVEHSLVWSPNGQYLLFDWSNFGPTMTRIPVYHLVDLPRKKITLISSNQAWSFPSWAPGSEWFVSSQLVAHTDQDGTEKYANNLVASNVRTFQKDRLTIGTSSDLYPGWSPDGRWVAFLRYTPESQTPKPGTGTECPIVPSSYSGCFHADLYLVRGNGSNPVLILKSAYIQMDQYARDNVYNTPSWSPDSKWLAVLTGVEQPDITLINIDTGESRVLAPHAGLDIYPAWSPDGTKLVFVSNREGNEDIYLISPDGSELVNLTNNPGSDYNPVWSPSGRYIAFLSDRDKTDSYKLYIMNVDGTGLRKLHDDSVFTRPSWFPLINVDLRKFFGFGNE